MGIRQPNSVLEVLVSTLQSALYVVATPIGNLEDISARALRILSQVDLIAAEDTRHSTKLLRHFGIRTPVTSLHEHNERSETSRLIKFLQGGNSIALVSDAGTPVISDPGFFLVRAARAADIDVTPIPGPCAAIAALSVAGLPSDKIVLEGFPPARAAARAEYFRERAREARTMIFYESPHRIVDSLNEMAAKFGGSRPAVLARELTKKFETIRGGALAEIGEWVSRDPAQRLGEFVIVVQGDRAAASTDVDIESERILRILTKELPLNRAAAVGAAITGLPKRLLYQHGLTWHGRIAPARRATKSRK